MDELAARVHNSREREHACTTAEKEKETEKENAGKKKPMETKQKAVGSEEPRAPVPYRTVTELHLYYG